MHPTKFQFIWPSGFRGEDFFQIDQSETRIAFGGHVCNKSGRYEHFYSEPSIDGSYQVSIHLAKRFQGRRNFKNWPIRNKNYLWRPCLLTDRDEMCNLYRGPSTDSSYQVSVHLAEGFQRRRLKCEKLTDDGRRMTDDGRQVMAKAHIAFGIWFFNQIMK